ncbi:response regulator transcription factor [Clostridium manihotivorum]|uniref:Stage 0 sporulation protein A homolog n=1 Tax=Clostridium manihotivorum TaxID=2320868 RepID=A0A3R5QXZ5_9CLOT|nr:response regulator [Clostridium manihotivorum]QAA35316.1 response regulator [Clostridium manihotivorum]
MRKILIADDEISLRFLISETLDDDDSEIYQAKDGQEALELVYEKKPDLLILDVMMPKLTGYEVIEKLGTDKGNMKIMLLTAKAQLSDREKAMESGADYFLTKPFSPMELLDKVDNIFQLHSKKEEEL